MISNNPHRSAFVALIGRPNSGKSTLLNTILGQDLSPVTATPQTTRRSIRGVYNAPDLQIVFTDTPGVHQGKYELSAAMLREAQNAVQAQKPDCVVYLVDLSRDFGDEEAAVAHIARTSGSPVVLLFNKKDLCRKAREKRREFYARFPEFTDAPSVILSAKDAEARTRLLAAIDPFVKEGPRYFDDEALTDASLRFFAAEYLRKQIILHTREEVPHATLVEIEEYREEPARHRVSATIHVETTGQRGIVLGSGGQLLEKIVRAAEKEMAKLADCPVEMKCHVKVTPHWRDDKRVVGSVFG